MRSKEEQDWFDQNMGQVRHIKIDDVKCSRSTYQTNILIVFATIVETGESISFEITP